MSSFLIKHILIKRVLDVCKPASCPRSFHLLNMQDFQPNSRALHRLGFMEPGIRARPEFRQTGLEGWGNEFWSYCNDVSSLRVRVGCIKVCKEGRVTLLHCRYSTSQTEHPSLHPVWDTPMAFSSHFPALATFTAGRYCWEALPRAGAPLLPCRAEGLAAPSRCRSGSAAPAPPLPAARQRSAARHGAPAQERGHRAFPRDRT